MNAAQLAALVLLHAPWTLASLAWCALARRRGVLTLTHAADVDASGVDVQMGPLVAALAERALPRVPVVLVPLAARAFLDTLRRERGPFLSQAVLFGAARLVALGRDVHPARARIAGLVLRACAPRTAFLIDESGSGQMFVVAARGLGTRTIGIQHGDFQPRNPQYAALPGRPFRVQPADVLCVWSPWFQARLQACSPIYERANTRVTGRLAGVEQAGASPPAGDVGVLVLAEASAGFAAAVEPFLSALRAEPGLHFCVRPHPASPSADWPAAHERAPGSLHEALRAADVVVGIGSSALLEGLRHGRPAIVLLTEGERDPAGYVAAGVAVGCGAPSELAALCRRLAGAEGAQAEALSVCRTVWGGAPPDPVEAVLACASPATGGSSGKDQGLQFLRPKGR